MIINILIGFVIGALTALCLRALIELLVVKSILRNMKKKLDK